MDTKNIDVILKYKPYIIDNGDFNFESVVFNPDYGFFAWLDSCITPRCKITDKTYDNANKTVTYNIKCSNKIVHMTIKFDINSEHYHNGITYNFDVDDHGNEIQFCEAIVNDDICKLWLEAIDEIAHEVVD